MFCILVALHAERARVQSSAFTNADQMQNSLDESAINLIRENERSIFSPCPVDVRRTEGKGPGLFDEHRDKTKAVSTTFSRIAEENVVLLRRILSVQIALENSDMNTESNTDAKCVGDYLPSSSSENCVMKSEGVMGKGTAPVTEGSVQGPPEASAVPSFFIISAAPQRVAHSSSSRKRTRSRSKSSSSSSQDDGARSRICLGRDRNPDVKNDVRTLEAPSEALEGAVNENIETKSSVLRESSPVASRRSRRQYENVLFTLLRDYEDDSDDSDNDGSNSEARDSFAIGDSQDKIGLDGLDNAKDMDIQGYTAPIAKLACTSQSGTSDHRSRRIRANSDMSTSIFATPPKDAEEMQNTPNGRDPAFALRDASLIRVVASAAHIVSALCTERTRRMVHPDLSATELGDTVDAIPPEMTQTCMAAQLALSERSHLEGCAAAWTELGLMASRLVHTKKWSVSQIGDADMGRYPDGGDGGIDCRTAESSGSAGLLSKNINGRGGSP